MTEPRVKCPLCGKWLPWEDVTVFRDRRPAVPVVPDHVEPEEGRPCPGSDRGAWPVGVIPETSE